MLKVGDKVVRVTTSNREIGSLIGTKGIIKSVDHTDKTYNVLLLNGPLKGKRVWWFHRCTNYLESRTPIWEI